MSFIFESKVLDIQKFKIMYVKQRITENIFKKDNLPLRLQSKNEIINDSNNWGSLVPFQF